MSSLKRKAVITFTFEEDGDQVVHMSHDIKSDGYSVYEIIGLLEVAKPGLVETSRERAQTIKEGKKNGDSGNDGTTGEPKL